MVMNNQRREEISKAVELIEEAKNILESILYEEQECLDNLPESLQYFERGQTYAENVDRIQESLSTLGEFDDLSDL